MQSTIIHSNSLSLQSNSYGGKADGLLLLKKYGYRIPDFYLLPDRGIRSLLNKEKTIHELVREWVLHYEIETNSLWAVRSSAGNEDGDTLSYAGLFRTVTNVRIKALPDAIEEVIGSLRDLNETNYQKNISETFNVIIQEMVRPDYAGVIFSRNPMKPDRNSMAINIVPGLGENLVSGRVTALQGEFGKGAMQWINPDDTFEGQLFGQKPVNITVTGHRIISDLEPHITQLIDGAKMLEKLRGFPVDMEFAISNSEIFWLQVRPVTAFRQQDNAAIYDNSNIGENYPGITLPLTITFVQYTYERAYTAMAQYLGMGRQNLSTYGHLFSHMTGGIYGALYYNITAWQQLLCLIPLGKITSGKIDKLLGMDPAPFNVPDSGPSVFSYLRLLGKLVWSFAALPNHKRKYLQTCDQVLNAYDGKVFGSMNHKQLINLYYKIDEQLLGNWLAPVLNGFYAMITMLFLRKLLQGSELLKRFPNFLNDMLYGQGDIISVNIVRGFQHLTDKIRDNPKLRGYFEQNSPEVIYRELPSVFSDFHNETAAYLDQYGYRCDMGELKLETFNYRDDPVRFIRLLKSNISGPVVRKRSKQDFDYRSVVKKYYRYRPVKKYFLLLLIKKNLHLIRDRENYRFIRTRMVAVIRGLFRAIGEVLFNEKLIDSPVDIHYLEHNEILFAQDYHLYKNSISKRKKEYELYAKMPHCRRYRVAGKSIIPVTDNTGFEPGETISGTGCSGGTVVNTVRVITPENISRYDFAGHILAGRYFEPGWISLFSKAAGIISEKGNLLGHTAILCREMGIPCVIGVKGLTTLVRDGDLIQMDGTTGEIRIIEHGK
jgi:phosphohistidine swiveling domain-containing protein